jgi:hypothetical protein
VPAETTALGTLVTGYLGAFPERGHLWVMLLLPWFDPVNLGDDPASFGTPESCEAIRLQRTAELVAS